MVVDERPNVLLYGPPGTGKTLLASAAAQGLDATFYSVKSGDLLSKFFGESPQLVGKLFEEAKNTSPSVVFIDEVESLSPDRDGPGGVSGPESRLLAQLLAELDGIDTKTTSELVITIAATNKPWLLDDAALSRFSRLVYVGLPDGLARQDMFELGIEKAGFETEVPMSVLSKQTQNYSGREISAGCREAIRTMLARANPDLESIVDQGADAVREYQLKKLPIRKNEIDQALAGVRFATGPEELAQYDAWKDGR
jgi:SpoVK/Ycf46/Vps4 family AAA+-type ATPase